MLQCDLLAFNAYILQQCVDMCSQYNAMVKNTTCQAVVIASDVAGNYLSGNGANCWLKYVLVANGNRREIGYTAAVLKM